MSHQKSHNSLPMQDSDTTRCINNCTSTARICLETLHYCLSQKGFSGKHIELLQTCAETCQLSSRLMMVESEFHHQACELCFEVCEACAKEFERYEEDEMFIRCAEACRRSAETCRDMAGMTVKIDSKSASGSQTTRM